MLDRLIALVALAMLTGFLAILAFKLQRVDLFVVTGITLALAGWDFFTKHGDKRDN